VKVPPLFEDRPVWMQLVGGIVVPVVFGILTGLALGWSEVVYYVMAGPIALAGGFLAGTEHRRTDEGVVRGVIGGLVYGSFILIGHEIANNAPKAHLPDPQSGLVFATALGGAILGGVGAYLATRRERGRSPAPAGSSASRR
jgi:predicted transporter